MSAVPGCVTMDARTPKVATDASVSKDIATYMTTNVWVS